MGSKVLLPLCLPLGNCFMNLYVFFQGLFMQIQIVFFAPPTPSLFLHKSCSLQFSTSALQSALPGGGAFTKDCRLALSATFLLLPPKGYQEKAALFMVKFTLVPHLSASTSYFYIYTMIQDRTVSGATFWNNQGSLAVPGFLIHKMGMIMVQRLCEKSVNACKVSEW